MRALAISDMHFGAWTGDPLLRHQFALDALEPHLDDIDELILLGDVFDLLFASVEDAFAQAEPFFELLADKLPGKRLVFLAGNHDHHIVVRYLRAAVELKIATGAVGEGFADVFSMQHHSFFARFLERRLPDVESEIVYPTYRVGDVLLSHGHYLDAHLENSIGNRLLARSAWSVAGGRPHAAAMIEDYEAVIVPLTELLFTVAQMPHGTMAQQAFYAQFRRLGRVLNLPSAARRRAHEFVRRSAHGNGHRPRLNDHRAPHDLPGVRACDPAAPVAVGIEAYAKVVRTLGWSEGIEHMVFAHTHQPLDGICDASEAIRFWNTGSWIYEPPRGDAALYEERAWPGTGVLIDTEQATPVLVEMLARGELQLAPCNENRAPAH
jgi:Calcineurin-like phosphoesterase